ncbi:pre-B lymphocyte protein 3 [Dryobates pubescens]|uniref:pre-B lymphocyte protein 3 n=1 Tax=Dryobates pubescens TaxID=118200 RepID=UPI0023B9E7A8|nr:pre-B lymphocyte protein 3 [Dryobates pubescens]
MDEVVCPSSPAEVEDLGAGNQERVAHRGAGGTWLSPSVTASLVHTASRAQPVLLQPPAVVVLPGQTARLSCTLSAPYNISQFGIAWFQQRPGQVALRYLLYYNSERDKHRPTKVPDRFSATKDLASNACILIIASARQEDNGSYYCSLSVAFHWA